MTQRSENIFFSQVFLAQANVTDNGRQLLRVYFYPKTQNPNVLDPSIIHNITWTLGDHQKFFQVKNFGLVTQMSFNDPISASKTIYVIFSCSFRPISVNFLISLINFGPHFSRISQGFKFYFQAWLFKIPRFKIREKGKLVEELLL